MSLYDDIFKKVKEMPTTSPYMDMSMAFKLLCEEVEKIKMATGIVDDIECVHCEDMFNPKEDDDMYCEECSEEYLQCGCKRDVGCMCYTR